MRQNKTITVLALAAIIVFQSCNSGQENKTKEAKTPMFPVTELQPRTITGFEEFPTNLEGVINSEVRAKMAGYIQKVLVDEGQKVRKGQVLFKLETQSLSQEASAAKARINVAEVEVDKLIPLVEKNIISSVQLATAKANLAQAKANYNSIAANIGYATVKSPVDGFVGTIKYREGSLISPSDPSPLTTVSDISKVYAFFSLNEKQYLDFLEHAKGKNLTEKLANFPPINLILANGSTYAEKGKIQTSSGQINPQTGTVSLRAVFDNPNQLLTNGNSGTIQIPLVYENATVIPQAATYEQQGNIMLFKVDNENKISSTVVKVKASVGSLYVLDSGLEKDEKIVVSGVGKLKNEMTISPIDTPFEEVIQPIPTLFKN
ncbi:efflux RND transporter periplasmic adaptor subunit [Putridiphycobacter roseus]|uniref:Efflux RND transporter periplasmic adaptor subunit n=1 Tax=Putridiphycobacter roseus TaxID=2219161 RepID=A0A2W1N2J3_9FLAO|nr:efflux RND transporter periplasmic adaptor subunit [Putridiphycobacter roseus]PZE18064.1 efflux RND transporter periplasmic adaptor subunit [Putridiphycobacter roseus]